MIGFKTIILDTHNSLISHGEIVDHIDNTLRIHPLMPLHHITDKVDIIITSSSNEIAVYEGYLSAISEHSLTITSLKLITEHERRKHQRVNTNLQSVIISRFKHMDFVANIENLSETGVLFRSDENLAINDIISFQFPVKINTEMMIFSGRGEIIRMPKLDNDDSFRYGCKFNDVKYSDHNILKTFIKNNIFDLKQKRVIQNVL